MQAVRQYSVRHLQIYFDCCISKFFVFYCLASWLTHILALLPRHKTNTAKELKFFADASKKIQTWILMTVCLIF